MEKFYPKLILAIAGIACSFTSLAGDADFSVDGIYYNIISAEDKTVEVTWPDETLWDEDPVYSGAITVPSTVNYNGSDYTVAAIGKVAFGDATVSSVSLPPTIKSIGKYGFSGATMKNLILPEGLEVIGECAFFECHSLESMVIPNSVTTIDEWAFEECKNMESLVIGNGIKTIPSTCFARCSALKELVIPEGVETIGYMSFAYLTNLESISLPSTLKTIEGYALGYCEHLASIEVPESVTSIGNGVFSACTSLAGITLPETITVYPEFLFGYCAEFREFEVPDHVTEIGPEVFDHCLSLENVTIGSGVQSIGSIAFRSCPLTEITVRADVPPALVTADSDVADQFDADVFANARLIVPQESVDAYMEAPGWKKFTNIAGKTSSVANIESTEAHVELFDMEGHRVSDTQKGQMVIVRQGNRTTKVII